MNREVQTEIKLDDIIQSVALDGHLIATLTKHQIKTLTLAITAKDIKVQVDMVDVGQSGLLALEQLRDWSIAIIKELHIPTEDCIASD